MEMVTESRKLLTSVFFLLLFNFINAQTVSSVLAEQQGNELVINYNLISSSPCNVDLYLSQNGGKSWVGPLQKVSGDVGKNIARGEKEIRWIVLEELVELVGNSIQFKVSAKLEKNQGSELQPMNSEGALSVNSDKLNEPGVRYGGGSISSNASNGEQTKEESSGSSAGLGVAFSLAGRTWQQRPSLDEGFSEQGKVVVDVLVDKAGNVVSAMSNPISSTTSSARLFALAEKATKNIKFSAVETAGNQRGTVTFQFKLK